MPAVAADVWRSDLTALGRAHQELREAVAKINPAALDRRSSGSRYTSRRMIEGIAMHDVYHAGQIQLLKRLMERG